MHWEMDLKSAHTCILSTFWSLVRLHPCLNITSVYFYLPNAYKNAINAPITAMLANSCKQMSMLTSSATRNALYNSFKRIDGVNGGKNNDAVDGLNRNATVGRRGVGATENIGDITAKGEAQIAVVDLLGIASGICLSSKLCFSDEL